MLSLNDNSITYQYHLCQQCGACCGVCPVRAISFEPMDNGLKMIIVNHDKCIKCGRCVSVCPSRRGLALESDKVEHDCYLSSLARKRYFLVCNTDNKVRRDASSGGAARTLIIESLNSGAVDAVYTLGRTDGYPFAEDIYSR